MLKLEKRLHDWMAEGLITKAEAAKIRAYEAARPGGSWILTGLLVLGIITVSIGVISLIAANWYTIPAIVKLFVDFAILILLVLALVYSWQSKNELGFEVLLLAFILFCLASIGLISQIYQTSGALYEALMLWSILTFGAAYAARKMFVPFFWLGGFLIGLSGMMIDSALLAPIFHSNFQAVAMLMPLLCIVMLFISRFLTHDAGPILALQKWILISGVIALIVIEFEMMFSLHFEGKLYPYIPGYILAVAVACGIILTNYYNLLQKVILVSALAVFILLFYLPQLQVKSQLAYAVCTLVILALMAIFQASMRRRRLFHLFIIFFGIRLLILYFQALGGLAMTGLGLVASGIVIITMAIVWNKYKTVLAIRAERWTHDSH